MDEQARLTDLVPRPLWAYLLILLTGLTVIAGLELLYSWMPSLARYTTDGRVEAFDLDGEGSLAVWFSSTTLTLAALVAVIVYTVRRHRRDDYHGHYRVWLWAAMCWLLMSLDETASLHEGFKEMMALVSGTRLTGGWLGNDGSIWWVAPYFFLLGAVGTRLLIDMRECWLSSTALVGTAVCYAVAVAAQLQWILPDTGARGVMLEEGAEMLGNLMLLLAMGLQARYVIMDAEGLIPARSAVTSQPGAIVRGAEQPEEDDLEEPDEVEEADSEPDRQLTVHPPHGVPRPATARPATRPIRREPVFVAVEQPEEEEEPEQDLEEDEPDDAPAISPVRRKLSKAEKKALRRRLKKMSRERERRRRAG